MKLRATAGAIVIGAGLFSLSTTLGCSGSPSSSSSGGAATNKAAVAVAAPVSAVDPAHSASGHKEWARAMARSTTPKAGCFKATHPSTQWEEVECATPPSEPMLPSTGGARAGGLQVGFGGTGDFAATVPGNITFAEGVFSAVSGVTKEAALAPGYSLSGYSLQLNTNTGTNTAICNQGPNGSGCTAWQQFVYLNGQIFMQYWLINYFATAPTGTQACPSGWNYDDNGYYVGTTVSHQYDCYRNSSGAASTPVYGPADLQNIVLSGTAGANDQVTLYYANQEVAYTINYGSVVNLDQWWKSAEYNVFGPGYGSAAIFNYGSTMAIQVVTDSVVPTTAASVCTAASYTGEINNLSLVAGSCCALGGSLPGIYFTQSNVPGAAAYPCP